MIQKFETVIQYLEATAKILILPLYSSVEEINLPFIYSECDRPRCERIVTDKIYRNPIESIMRSTFDNINERIRRANDTVYDQEFVALLIRSSPKFYLLKPWCAWIPSPCSRSRISRWFTQFPVARLACVSPRLSAVGDKGRADRRTDGRADEWTNVSLLSLYRANRKRSLARSSMLREDVVIANDSARSMHGLAVHAYADLRRFENPPCYRRPAQRA